MPAEYQYILVKDSNGKDLPFPPFITQEHLDLVKRVFKARPDDVIVDTYPKAGTTWTTQIVHLLVRRGEQGDKVLNEAVPWIEAVPIRYEDPTAVYEGFEGRRTFSSHNEYGMMPEAVRAGVGKVVYVIRNPKDVAVSYYHHEQAKMLYEGTWDEYFELFITGQVHFGFVLDHYRDWWHASQHQDNILFLTYEGMKADLPAAVRLIAVHIDVPLDDDLLEKVVTGSTFKAMKANEKTNFKWMGLPEDKPPHIRKGIVGDWRNFFTPEQDARMQALIDERLADTDIKFDFGE